MLGQCRINSKAWQFLLKRPYSLRNSFYALKQPVLGRSTLVPGLNKIFFRPNGNISVQALFQQRSLRTKAPVLVQPVLEEKDKSAEDKDEKDKFGLRRGSNLVTGAAVLFMMYTMGTVSHDAPYVRTKVFDQVKFGDDQDDSDAKDSEDEFNDFELFGEKKTKFEELYRRMHEKFVKWGRELEEEFEKTEIPKIESAAKAIYQMMTLISMDPGKSEKAFENMVESGKSEKEFENVVKTILTELGKSEEEFENMVKTFPMSEEKFKKMMIKMQKEMYFDKVVRRLLLGCFIPGLWLAYHITYMTVYKRSLPKFFSSWRVFIQLFTVLPSLSYFGVRAYVKGKLKP